jgi:hypothetical protein
MRLAGQMHEAAFHGAGLGIEAHDLVAFGHVAGDRADAGVAQLLSKLRAPFHCEHLSAPLIGIEGIETPTQDRYTFAPPSKRSAKPVQWYTLPPRFIVCLPAKPENR